MTASDICHRITRTDQTDTSEASRLTSPRHLSASRENAETLHPNGRSGYYVCPTIARRSLHHSTPTNACYCLMTCAARSSLACLCLDTTLRDRHNAANAAASFVPEHESLLVRRPDLLA